MSRFQRFKHAALSGYAAQLLNAICALVTIPLALRYLSPEEFGLWSLSTQIAGYFGLIDFGTRYAIARTLIDHKDDQSDGRYGAVLKAGLFVGAVQGIIVVALGVSLLGWLAGWLRVPEGLRPAFFWLLSYQFVVTGLSFVTRVFPQLLVAWQRADISNYAQIVQNAIWPLGLWLFFHLGWGVYAALASNGMAWLVATALTAWATFRFRLWPKGPNIGRLTLANFKDLFSYTTDVFLIAFGSQIILTGQSLLVTRLMDFSALAAWSILSKTFGMISQVLFGTVSMSMPAFAEMQARRETERLWSRYRAFYMTLTAGAAALMVCFAACNQSFVKWWTSDRMDWSQSNDVVLAAWILLLTHQCAHNSMLLSLKKAKSLSYIYIIEGIVFVASAWYLIPRAGFMGMLLSSFLCTLLFTYAFGLWQIHRLAVAESQAGSPLQWHLPSLKILLLMSPIAWLINWLLQPAPPLLHLLVAGTSLVITAFFALFGFALPKTIAVEIAARLPAAPRRLATFVANRSAFGR